MKQYINKAALVAEIENWKQHTLKCGYAGQGEYEEGNKQGRLDTCEKILSFLDILEVKEVDEEYNGKAMLHVLEKGVKQGKRELVDKACEWLDDNLHHYWGSISADPHNFLFDFRKAMED